MSLSASRTQLQQTPENSDAAHQNHARRTPFFKKPAQSFFRPVTQIQPKLTVNTSNDNYEKEADAMADRVMRMPDPQVQRQEEDEEEMRQMKEDVPAIQRKCKACETEESVQRQPMEEEEEVMLKLQFPAVQRKCAECEAEEKLQRTPLAGNITLFFQRKEADGKEVSPQTEASLQSTKGSGKPFPDDSRSWMESRFGADFSGVKVHTDSNAVQLSRELNAKAFTHGSDIYFNRGEFAPGTSEGKRLLAHELTHVVQQSGESGFIQRQGFASTMEICHNYLRSRTFRISTGGIRVTTNARISDPGNPHCQHHRFSIELRKEGLIFDDPYGTCDFSTSSQPASRAWGGLPEGEYYLGINRLYDNPYCCLEGDIEVNEVSSISEGSCTELPPGPLEIIHTALQGAGMIPALGVVPDAIDTGLYIIEGEWTNAGISAAAMLPIFGQGATITRAGLKVTGEAAERTGREAIEAALQRTRRLLRTMRAPRSIPYGRTMGSIDGRLLERAKEVRATQAGVSRTAFRQHNVATARVRVDGEVRYLDTGNMPRGAHSEEYLHAQIVELRRGGSEVRLEQLYTERIPCRPTCGPLLGREYPNTEVFFTTRANNAAARAQELMEAYGITTR